MGEIFKHAMKWIEVKGREVNCGEDGKVRKCSEVEC
jgi:hypothetical protein